MRPWAVQTASATIGLALLLVAPAALSEETTIIKLTHVACQFLEAEDGRDHGFETARRADCERINEQTAAERLANVEVLTVPAGKYVFRVTNRDVPYEVGFWLREGDYDWRNPVHKLTKTSVGGGGLMVGQTRDYMVELTPGEYLYSCPLNTTPDYRLVVRE